MDFYESFENAIYDSLEAMFPLTTIIFAHDNAPENVTPYITIQVIDLDNVGREEIETLVTTDDKRQIVKHYESKVIIKFVGDESKQVLAGSLASDFEFFLDSPAVQDTLSRNNLSLMRKSRISRIPAKWDTAFYMVYSIDVYFAFSVVARQDSDYINVVNLKGTLYD